MANNRTLFLLYMSAMTIFFIFSCKDDDGPYIDIPTEDVFTLTRDSVQVDFRLINEQGDTTTLFREGEDIIFDLKVVNTSLLWIHAGDYDDFLSKDLFRVFTDDGRNKGVCWHFPYDWLGGDQVEHDFGLVSMIPAHFQCSWQGRAVSKPTYPLVQLKETKALPQGEYYVMAQVHIDTSNISNNGFGHMGTHGPSAELLNSVYANFGGKRTITCGIHFKIQ